ncbi:hypothetical protein SCG7086_AB_00110 [Chlamydiales bacterium SCGC AG-110-P3]|nr:hypothetical protein SCG7086_AB_00110 [Chlamydiales bacterium SCGC AG-110-P3]
MDIIDHLSDNENGGLFTTCYTDKILIKDGILFLGS